MLKETITNNKVFVDNFQFNNNQQTKITGILTSSIRTKESSNTPYYCFFRPDSANSKHSLEECERIICKDCEIAVIFRIKRCDYNCLVKECAIPKCQNCWIKPNLKKGDKVILAGKFSQSEDNNRPSFTCYSYRLINDKDCSNSYQIIVDE